MRILDATDFESSDVMMLVWCEKWTKKSSEMNRLGRVQVCYVVRGYWVITRKKASWRAKSGPLTVGSLDSLHSLSLLLCRTSIR